MTQYLVVAAVVFAVNLLPAFGPPTWAVLVFFRLHSDVNAVALVVTIRGPFPYFGFPSAGLIEGTFTTPPVSITVWAAGASEDVETTLRLFTTVKPGTPRCTGSLPSHAGG